MRYRKNVLEAHLPEPPKPWADIYREFERVDESMSREPWPSRLMRLLAGPAARRWGVALATVLVIALVFYQQFRGTPSVEAATILKRAVTAADSRPMAPRRLMIQTRTQRMTRVVGNPRLAKAAEEPLAATLEERFDAAHYSWDDPLSAKAYQAWFNSLITRHEEVTTVADPEWPAERCYQIRTETPEGTLAAASLLLRTTDLSAVESKLEFRDKEWVELSEITDATTRDDGRPVATNVGPPMRRTEPSRFAATSPGATASVSDELQVLAALHEIGADLGDPVEVTLAGGKVLVNGVGIPAGRQKQIREHLDGMANVRIDFSDPTMAAMPAEPAGPDGGSPGSKPSAIQSRVEQQVGGRAEFERFSSQVLDRNESMMSHAYALRALAQRFPAGADAGLAQQDREVLREMARDHATRLAREAATIERALAPILTGMGGTAQKTGVAAQEAWEPAAEDLFQVSRRVEVLVSVMLGAARGDASAERLPTELLTAIRQLRADADQCQVLLGR